MSYAHDIVQQAQILATSAGRRAAALERELADIEKRKLELQAQLHAAHLAHKRLNRFVPELRGELQCPRCWIEHGAQACAQSAAAPRVTIFSGATPAMQNSNSTFDETNAMTSNLKNPIFTDETAAREWLEARVWPNGPVCPHCGVTSERVTKLEGGTHRPGLYQCEPL